MTEKYQDTPELQWQQMNVTALDFPDATFDVVIAKGIIDTILCGEGSTVNTTKMCNEVCRVLKPKGCFFVVSYGIPENRMSCLERETLNGWVITTHTILKPNTTATATGETLETFHYIYVCLKGNRSEKTI